MTASRSPASWREGRLRGKKSSPHARGGASAVGSVSGPWSGHSATREMRMRSKAPRGDGTDRLRYRRHRHCNRSSYACLRANFRAPRGARVLGNGGPLCGGVAARPNPARTDGRFQVISADYLIIWMSCLLIGTVTDLALVMEEHRAAHRIAGLALVQPGMAMLAQVGVSQPIGSPADLLRAGGEHRVRQASGRHWPFTWAGRLGSRSEATTAPYCRPGRQGGAGRRAAVPHWRGAERLPHGCRRREAVGRYCIMPPGS